MIIDGHAHLYPHQVAQKVIDSFTEFHRMEPTSSLGKGIITDLQDRMNCGHIDYTVVANFAPVKSIQRTNEWTLSISKEYANLIPLVSVCPGMPLDEIKRYFSLGAKGIKMHTGIQGFEPTDTGLKAMYRFCENNRIPITFHCGATSRVHMNEYSEMSHILPAVKAYPGIPFVLTHLATGDPEQVLKIAVDCPNAILDTSITLTGEHCIHRIHDDIWENDENAVALFQEIGCHRITFGSDYPFGNPNSDIQRIQAMKLTDAEKKQILGENTWRLYFSSYNLPL